jgi:SAM-dependent methyltransferase
MDDESAHERRRRDDFAEEDYRFSIAQPLENEMEMVSTLGALAPCGRVVLELGCGTGRYTMPLARESKMLLAVDFSIRALHIVANNLPSHANVGLAHVDIAHFAVAPRAFDACLSTCVSSLSPAHRRTMYQAVGAGLGEGPFVFSTHFHNQRRRLGGIPQAGRYGEGGIFRYFFRRTEIQREVQQYFATVRVWPIKIRLPLLARLGLPAVTLSRYCERLPLVNRLGELLLVTATRPISTC